MGMARLAAALAAVWPLARAAHLLRGQEEHRPARLSLFSAEEVHLEHEASRVGFRKASSYMPLVEGAWIETERIPDIQPAVQGAAMSPAQMLSLFGVALLLLVALSPVGYEQGLRAFAAVFMYIVCICFVKVFAKEAFNQGFRFPYTLTAMHMLVTAVAASLIDRPLLHQAKSTFSISAVKAVSLGLNNSALLFGTAAFISIIGSLTPCATFLLDVARTRQLSAFRSCTVLLVCAGAAVCTTGEVRFSVLALVFALGACLARSLKAVWSFDLLEGDVGVYHLAAWSSIWSFLIMIVIALCTEGRAPYHMLSRLNARGLAGVLVSCVAAAVLNILQCFVLKYLGPVVQSLFGTLELVAVMILAMVLLREQVTRTQWLGVLLICLGCAAIKGEGACRAAVKRAFGLGSITESDSKQKPKS
mmetsp:Transcript_109882/g.342509  ORF Transcript_109882/g.342509 Transcript_109882/m.342509 type:complete len:418 (+) Transcript_109882:72-1325(+)